MNSAGCSLATLFVTGGAGFIGSALVRLLVNSTSWRIVNIDKLTYAGNLESLVSVTNHPRYQFRRADICDRNALNALFSEFRPLGIIHLAAESHVDRSIHSPGDFIKTNVLGSYELLETSLGYWRELSGADRASFRFLHVSTDEVFGSLGPTGLFDETSPYAPNSPYSASKAASDHLARAWHHTYGLPVIITNCSNNYGPYQFPEKLIPLIVQNALLEKPLPIYGNGENVRDWLFVDDHAGALLQVFRKGSVGDTYNIGGNNELTNNQVVEAICLLLDEIRPRACGASYRELITYFTDRPGHDKRYAIDATKMHKKLGWEPKEDFASGLRRTVEWYLDNTEWISHVRSGEYRDWIKKNYGARN